LSSLIEHDVKLVDEYGTLAGLDEAGRGALAGPVFVGCAGIYPDILNRGGDKELEKIDDSKKLTEKVREELFRYLAESEYIAIAIGHSSNSEIDKMGINDAVSLAADRALECLGISPALLLADKGISPGNRPEYNLFRELKKGDEKSAQIAAASILAKVGRDRYMRGKSIDYQGYGWDKNVGYGTAEHRDAIKENGPSDLHRISYKLA